MPSVLAVSQSRHTILDAIKWVMALGNDYSDFYEFMYEQRLFAYSCELILEIRDCVCIYNNLYIHI